MKKTLSLALCSLSLVVLMTACTPASAPTDTDTTTNTESQEESTIEATEEVSTKIQPFTTAAFTAAKGNQPVAIHFTAEWCPTCKALDKTINERAAELPEDAIVFLADYDNETALKAEHGITVQTTVVFFDKEGNKTETINNPKFEKINELLSA
ncbi:MAG: thioredoxin family protein [Candidatus Gracilibacteria bacterium]|nr:thioredoxin family protein [Candidatus Gracilibacteria bacterium]